MFESLEKLMLAGLGAATMTKERAEKIFDEYARRGDAERKSRSGFVKELMDAADKSRRDLEKMVAQRVDEAVARANLATKADIQRLEQKLAALLKTRQ